MNIERAVRLGFQCPTCQEYLHEFGTQYECTNGSCFNNQRQLDFKKRLQQIRNKRR